MFPDVALVLLPAVKTRLADAAEVADLGSSMSFQVGESTEATIANATIVTVGLHKVTCFGRGEHKTRTRLGTFWTIKALMIVVVSGVGM